MEEIKKTPKPLPADRFELVDIRYEEISWYRKRWFMVVTILFFMPLTLAITLSGDLYLKRKNQVYKMLPKQKRTIVIVCVMFMAIGLIRMVAQV